MPQGKNVRPRSLSCVRCGATIQRAWMVLRTVNPAANPDVWANGDNAPYWHMGVSASPTIDGFRNVRAFAPTFPGASPAERPATTVSFEDMVRPIDPAAL